MLRHADADGRASQDVNSSSVASHSTISILSIGHVRHFQHQCYELLPRSSHGLWRMELSVEAFRALLGDVC